jgi:beta-lactamase class A
VTIGAADLGPPPSRINRLFQGAPLSLPAADLIVLTARDGDNTAVDALMRRLGGPAALSAWLAGHGLGDLRVDRYERELQTQVIGLGDYRPEWALPAAWSAAEDAAPAGAREAALAAYLADPRDTATVPTLTRFLTLLAGGGLISVAATAFLLRVMTAPKGAASGLAAGLPPGAAVAHKAGASTTSLGLTPAANDIGLVTLADGRRFAIAVLLAGSNATAAQRGALIADAARLAVAALN